MHKQIFRLLLITIVNVILSNCSQTENFEGPIFQLQYEYDITPEYHQIIDYYKKLDNASPISKLIETGTTDAGKPLHLFIIDKDRKFDPASSKKDGKTILFINNGIHPGEPCGIDASLKFADEMLRNVNNLQNILDKVTICIIPVYNVGGCLNRSAYHRANQVGPKACGFRGNARNLDLNRDFVKCDSKNAQSFAQTFTYWNPDLLLDTHTTNGSDHQYAVTLIPPCPSVFPEPMGSFIRNKMLPDLYNAMNDSPYDMTPYVYYINHDPSDGIRMTYESPRFSSGFARIHNCYGFMTENHVYKNYTDRVLSAYEFMKVLAQFAYDNFDEIIDSRTKGIENMTQSKKQVYKWEIDTTQYSKFNFKGYKAGKFKSNVTQLERFGYDKSQPYEKEIKYFDVYNSKETISKPQYYIIPQAWHEVIDRLKWNNVNYHIANSQQNVEGEVYYFTEVSHPSRPNNGHYYHSNINYEIKKEKVTISEGDIIVPTDQEKSAYIIELLEPKCADSFMRWNFFDSRLDHREYFSSWGFEENAQKYLDSHPEFKAKFEEKVKNDEELINNHFTQMAYIYNESEWVEPTYMQYPIFRIETEILTK